MEQFVEFAVNSNTIRGILHTPKTLNTRAIGTYPGLVLCHGFTGNKIGLHRLFVKAARNFSSLGFAVLRFDFSGCGDSDGNYEDITIDGQVQETIAAIEYLSSLPEISKDKVYLTGLSMGGAVAALTAAEVKTLAGLVLWAPVANLYEDNLGTVGTRLLEEIRDKGIAEYQGFALGRPFVQSLQNNFPLTAVRNYPGPLLVLHGTADVEISPWNAELYRQARNKLDSTVVSQINGADHTFTGLDWEEEIFNITAKWLREEQRGERFGEKKRIKMVSGLGGNTWHTGT
jgi:pimeloyl-ACP methyl ester carboxylesterase